MPRHTHPPAVRKHPRSATRYHRDRYIARRWRQAKDRYGYRWGAERRHPEAVVRQPASGGRWEQVDVNDWPFYWPDGFFARNPWTLCSCWMCRYDDGLSRSAEKRRWRQQEEAARGD